MEEKLKELLEVFEKTLEEQQNYLNEMRNQIINLKKELNLEISEVPAVNLEVLEEAKDILIREFFLETDLSTRIKHVLYRMPIDTLKDLYYLNLQNPEYRLIRNIGPKSAEEIKRAISDMQKLVSRIKERRKNVEKYNQHLNLLLDYDIAKEIMKQHEVTSLKELYEDYIQKRSWYNKYSYESEVIELLKRY